jgi:hypothetical protein
MRRVSLLMVLAMAALMSLGTTGAVAGGKSGGKNPTCKYGKYANGKCKPKPRDCRYGKGAGGKCKPKPREDCQYGKDISGKCKPKPPECPYGKDKDGNCNPPPIVVPTPTEGPCSLADLVLLEDLLKGTGALACLYLGDNAPNASADKDCPESLIALPIDNLLGACVYLPPADVSTPTADASTPTSAVSTTTSAGSAPSAAQESAVDRATGGSGLGGVVSTLMGLLNLGGTPSAG